MGVCVTNTPTIAGYANRAIQRLIFAPEQPDTGWFGTIVPMVFNLQRHWRHEAYITTPRGIARIAFMDVCLHPVHVQNRFYEYLWAGVGTCHRECSTWNTEAVDRSFYPTFVELGPAPMWLTATPTDTRDTGKRILIQCTDQNGLKIYSTDNGVQVEGFFLTLGFPSVTSPFQVTGPIYGIQKDVTYGDVILSMVDPVTAVVTQLSRYEPGETRPQYRRYILKNLRHCCQSVCPTRQDQVEVLAKRDYYPVAVDTDWLLIGNIEAVIQECRSIRAGEMDAETAPMTKDLNHLEAVRLLRGELDHYQGKEAVAANVAPFGTARPERQRIGTMV